MDAEYNALMQNKTWTLVKPQSHKNIIGCRWTFKIKRDSNGAILKHKARLVAKGYTQQFGFDFTETFSPVIKPTTLRIILTIALHNKWNIRQLDVNNAFLNGELEEEVYMQQPIGYSQGTELVCKLHKAIYGLKQAPRVWYEKLQTTLVKLGYKATKSDTSLYIRTTANSTTYILVYVDDIIITGKINKCIQNTIQFLDQCFSIKDLG